MKYLIPPLVLLSACSPEPRTTEVQSLDTFSPPDGKTYTCKFVATDEPASDTDSAVFVTLAEDPQERARMSYGREMFMLFPKDPPRLDGTEEELIYSVENYPSYDARLSLTLDGDIYAAVVEFRRYDGDVPTVVATRTATGGCS